MGRNTRGCSRSTGVLAPDGRRAGTLDRWRIGRRSRPSCGGNGDAEAHERPEDARSVRELAEHQSTQNLRERALDGGVRVVPREVRDRVLLQAVVPAARLCEHASSLSEAGGRPAYLAKKAAEEAKQHEESREERPQEKEDQEVEMVLDEPTQTQEAEETTVAALSPPPTTLVTAPAPSPVPTPTPLFHKRSRSPSPTPAPSAASSKRQKLVGIKFPVSTNVFQGS